MVATLTGAPINRMVGTRVAPGPALPPNVKLSSRWVIEREAGFTLGARATGASAIDSPFVTDADAPAQLSPAWQQRFAFFAAYGLPSSSRESQAAIRALPFRDRIRITSNFVAMIFFPFYFFVKGMWRKGLVWVGVVIACGAAGIALDVSDQIARAIGIGLACGSMTTANFAYYLHAVHGSVSWNILEGFGRRSAS